TTAAISTTSSPSSVFHRESAGKLDPDVLRGRAGLRRGTPPARSQCRTARPTWRAAAPTRTARGSNLRAGQLRPRGYVREIPHRDATQHPDIVSGPVGELGVRLDIEPSRHRFYCDLAIGRESRPVVHRARGPERR